MSFNSKLGEIVKKATSGEESWIHDQLDGTSYVQENLKALEATRTELKQSIIQAVLDELPEKITLGDIDKGIPANYGRNDNADTQRGYNKAIDDIRKSIKGSDD